ncbi:MAG: F0F1 ATP synthase subunit A [Clostridiales bacterium]|nr:F0F1 ATP synthase subunit A [Clostridiales bacterium]
MNVQVTGPYIYYTIPILGGINITQTTVSCLVVTVILIAAMISIGKSLKTRPEGKQALAEKGVLLIRNMVVDSMGEHNAHWTPFILTIFMFSICGSLIGMTGFLRSVTADLSCTLAWALTVTGIIWYNNIRREGFFGWLKGFTQPIAVMTPMNIISEIAQPVSMAFRHFGNIAGGGVITGILYTALSMFSAIVLKLVAAGGWVTGAVLAAFGVLLIAFGLKKHKKGRTILGGVSLLVGVFGILEALGLLSGVPVLALGIPAVLSLYFDLFSAFVQALVFSLLTMVYIAGSCPAKE